MDEKKRIKNNKNEKTYRHSFWEFGSYWDSNPRPFGYESDSLRSWPARRVKVREVKGLLKVVILILLYQQVPKCRRIQIERFFNGFFWNR